jgi:hypothetical protein
MEDVASANKRRSRFVRGNQLQAGLKDGEDSLQAVRIFEFILDLADDSFHASKLLVEGGRRETGLMG